MRMLLLPFLLALAGAGAAQPAPVPQQQAQPRLVTVLLDSFDFTPRQLHLRAGQPIVLQLINQSGRRHNFSAPFFFSRAAIAPGQPRILSGEIEVPPNGRVEIRLTPARGTYELECTHSGHAMIGMEGMIRVD
ncbi:MAG: hypothetical protein QOJ53_1575 [Sphingomonadales bacterium]|jgi:uncharacterized cupredoxin-like copper-binding protein|nr:hypothetical protein [Sphingomonadales bacterium]MEA3047243.1 hypothetical protein [Sphingomonadales bacterium]